MDRGAWWATAHGVTRVRHDLAIKPPPPSGIQKKHYRLTDWQSRNRDTDLENKCMDTKWWGEGRFQWLGDWNWHIYIYYYIKNRQLMRNDYIAGETLSMFRSSVT